jgi:hypothetical protein
VQDYSGGIKGEKITLGFVTLNLAEYVEESESADGEEGVVRRYLMQESKINSTLKIGISMKQIDGERNFVAPPLKTAPVFGGIAGIMGGGEAEQDELGSRISFLPILRKVTNWQTSPRCPNLATIPNSRICTAGPSPPPGLVNLVSSPQINASKTSSLAAMAGKINTIQNPTFLEPALPFTMTAATNNIHIHIDGMDRRRVARARALSRRRRDIGSSGVGILVVRREFKVQRGRPVRTQRGGGGMEVVFELRKKLMSLMFEMI